MFLWKIVSSLAMVAALGCAQPKVNLDSILAEAATLARTADSWTAEGTVSVRGADGRVTSTEQFRIDFHQTEPFRARLEITGGQNPLIRICDGSSQWTFYPKKNEYIRVAIGQFNPCVYPLNAWPGLRSVLPAAKQIGTAKVMFEGSSTECQVVRGATETSGRIGEICLDPRTKLVLRFQSEQTQPTARVRIWTFSSLKRNTALDQNSFAFRPPAGSKEVGVISWMEGGIPTSNTAVRASNDAPPPDVVSAVAAENSGTGPSGLVVLTAEVNADGIPQNIKILRSLTKLRDDQAVEAVKQWRFDKRDYVPLKGIITAIGVNF